MTIIVGLTGGIASGKSFVASYLKKIKIPVHESDKIVANMYKKPSRSFIFFLKKEGFKNFFINKKFNKKKIRDEIFNNIKKKQKLEKFIHNEVSKNRKYFLKKNKDKKIIFLDIPLLFEKKLQKICDFVCSTITPLKKRQLRALQRPKMTKKIFKLIVKNQTRDKIRKKESNYIINTSSSKTKTCLQVNNIIYDILNKNQ